MVIHAGQGVIWPDGQQIEQVFFERWCELTKQIGLDQKGIVTSNFSVRTVFESVC